jgi:hypothetical protein
VRDRELAAQFDRKKLLNQIEAAYRRAPEFESTFELVTQIVRYEDANLFRFILNSIVEICAYLEIGTEIRVSSTVNIDHDTKSQSKVIALCEALGATTYINASGGVDLYSKSDFEERGIELNFLQSSPVEYQQFGAPFVPWLSIVDVLMFNPIETVRNMISTNYELA